MTSHHNARETLSRLWTQALNSSTESQVEDHEKFFESGGDSMAAIGMYTAVEEQLEVEIDPGEFLGTLADGNFADLVKLADAAVRDRVHDH